MARFFAMPVCLKSAIIAKPLSYIRIYNYGFMFVIVMCKLYNFFGQLSTPIVAQWEKT